MTLVRLTVEEKEFIDLLGDVGRVSVDTSLSIDAFREKIEEQQGYKIFNWETVSDIVTHEGDPLCVISCAGSGKTTVLLYRLCYRLRNGLLDPSKTMVISFLKSDAEKLKKEFAKICYNMGIDSALYNSIRFGTVHSVFLEMIRHAGINWRIINEGERCRLIRTASRGYAVLKAQEEVMELSSLFTLVDNSLLPINDIINGSTIKTDISPQAILGIYTRFKTLKHQEGVLDFDDIQTYLYEGITKNKGLARYVSNLYNSIYIDECQDLSTIQYEILKAYFKGEDKDLFVIGDDDQAIYSWRGGNIDIITNRMISDFGFTVKKLEYNYRSKSNIVNFVKSSIVKNSIRYEKDLKAYSDGGEVRLLYSKENTLLDMAQLLEDELKKFNFKEINNTAVLVRENKQALPVMLMLMKNKIDFIVTNDVMNLRSDKAFSTVLNLIKMCANSRTLTECGGILKSILGWKSNKVQSIAEKLLDLNREDVLLYAEPLLPIYDIAKQYQVDRDFEKMVYDACTSFATTVYMYNRRYGERLFHVSNCIEYMRRNFIIGDFTLFSLDEIVTVIDEEIILHRNQKTGVTISTVHGAKGKGWETVIIFPDVQGSFPPDMTDAVEVYEEERRLHYVACTRARDRLFIVTYNKLEGDYLLECDMNYSNIQKDEEGLT